MRYLFRGVSEELYRKLAGKLIPKIQAPFGTVSSLAKASELVMEQ